MEKQIAILQVPARNGSIMTPWMGSTKDGLILECLDVLKADYPKAAIRHEVKLDEKVYSADFYQLQDKDATAGTVIFQYMISNGWNIDQTSISYSTDGSVVGVTYSMSQEK